MSDPVVKINWSRLAPFVGAYANVMLGELAGFALVALAAESSIFHGWTELGTAFLGGLVLEVILEWNDPPPNKKNAKRRRTIRVIAGFAYGTGAVNLVGLAERIIGAVL